MNTNATAADYAWLDEDLPGLTEAYCLTLVRGLAPEEVLRRIGAREGLRITGDAVAIRQVREHIVAHGLSCGFGGPQYPGTSRPGMAPCRAGWEAPPGWRGFGA